MNKKQLWIMWISVIVTSAMFLFPPWQYRLRYREESIDIKIPAPYRLLFFGAPQVPVASRVKEPYIREYFQNHERDYWTVEIDWIRLLIPVGIISLSTIALLMTFQKNYRSS